MRSMARSSRGCWTRSYHFNRNNLEKSIGNRRQNISTRRQSEIELYGRNWLFNINFPHSFPAAHFINGCNPLGLQFPSVSRNWLPPENFNTATAASFPRSIDRHMSIDNLRFLVERVCPLYFVPRDVGHRFVASCNEHRVITHKGSACGTSLPRIREFRRSTNLCSFHFAKTGQARTRQLETSKDSYPRPIEDSPRFRSHSWPTVSGHASLEARLLRFGAHSLYTYRLYRERMPGGLVAEKFAK